MDLSSLIAKRNAEFNEEQTKHALVLPILDRLLGWDVYDESTVIPEFTADTPGKNGEKIDYALDLQGDGQPEVLIEAKALGSRLSDKAAAQLYRYFATTEARIGILTDGFRWMLFTDLEKANIMDAEPFLNFTLEDLAASKPLENLFKNLSRENFDINRLRNWGEYARDANKLDTLVKAELTNPSDDLAKFFFSRLYTGQRATASRLEEFKRRLAESLKDQRSEYPPASQGLEKTIASEEKNSQRKGYFVDDKGHTSSAGSLRQAWIEYWKNVASDPKYTDALKVFVTDQTFKQVFLGEEKKASSGQSLNSELCPGVWITSTLSSSSRLELLDRISSKLELNASVIYTD